MVYRDYTVLIEPSSTESSLRGRAVMLNDEVTFSAPDMGRFRKEAAAAIDFYLAACESAGRPADPPAGKPEWVVLSDSQANEVRKRAKEANVSVSRVLSQLIGEALPNDSRS